MIMIAAVDKNWAIGHEGKLLVKIPLDHQFFQQMTKGKVIVLGRKTLETFPNGLPLPGRTNVVLSQNKDFKVKGAVCLHGMEEALDYLSRFKQEEIFIVGGESIYRQFLPYSNTIHITKIDYAYQADSYFPNLNELSEWVITGDSEEQTYFDLEYTFLKYEKKSDSKH